MTTTLLRAGDVIGGFRIDDVIGIGGMAIVYRAEQISLGRPVAVKVLTSKLTNDEVFRERFRREGTHAAGLEHPNIVPVYDSGEQDGNLYIAMRLVDGTNLAELIQARGLTADQAIELLRPLASALDTAHAAGLIHRDVKPQNILITAHGHPYLADFGVAKGSNTEDLTATGSFVGSVHYASPEQIKGLTLTPASDIYALTAVLYQCLTGQVPFPRETDAGVMHAHLNDPPPTLPASSGADSDFHTVLARGMAKDPGSRYGHAGDLVNAAALCVSRLPAELRKAVPAFPEPAPSPEPLEPPGPMEPPEPAKPPLGRPANETEIVAADELAAVRVAPSFTAADRRRAPAPSPSPSGARVAKLPKALIAGIATALIAAGAIVVLATAGSGGAHALTFHSGDLVFDTGPGWKRAAIALTGLALAEPVSISDAQTAVEAGTLSKTAKVPASLPPALTARYGRPTQTSVSKLPLGRAKSYTWTDSPSGPLSLLIVVTGRGEIAIACTTSAASRLPAMRRTCGAIRAGAKIVDTQVGYPGPDPRVASALSSALAPRAQAIAASTARIGSAHLAARAGALQALAAKDTATVRTLAGLSAPSHDAAAIATLARGLGQEAARARAASAAALRHSTALYESVRRRPIAVRMSTAEVGLAAVGFTGLALPPLDIPRAPSRPHRHAVTPPATTPSTTSISSAASQTSSTYTAATPVTSTPSPPAPTPASSNPAPARHHAPEIVTSKPE
jgi:serine/threonine protein kinase